MEPVNFEQLQMQQMMKIQAAKAACLCTTYIAGAVLLFTLAIKIGG